MLRAFKIIPAYTSSSSSALFQLPKAAVWVITHSCTKAAPFPAEGAAPPAPRHNRSYFIRRMSPSTHSSGLNSQHPYQSGWLNQESRLVTLRQLWWNHTIYGNISRAPWSPLDVQVRGLPGRHRVGTAPRPHVGAVPTQNQPREGLIAHLSLHLHSRSKGKDPYKSPSSWACCRLWELQLSWWEKPLAVQSTKLHFYTYFVLQQG